MQKLQTSHQQIGMSQASRSQLSSDAKGREEWSGKMWTRERLEQFVIEYRV